MSNFLLNASMFVKWKRWNWSSVGESAYIQYNINSFIHLAHRLAVLPAKAGLTTNERSDANKAL